MAVTEKVDFDSLAAADPKEAEAIYRRILQGDSLECSPSVEAKWGIESKPEDEQDNEARLKEQESALVKLAELYRDQKSVQTPSRIS